MMEKLDKLVDLYVSYAGTGPVSSEPLPVSGSNRKYFRLTGKDGKSVIGTSGESSVENRVFVETDRHLASKGVRVPEIYAVSGDFSVYLQEDLGNESLFDAVSSGRLHGEYGENEAALLETAVRKLPLIGVKGAEGFDFSACTGGSGFGRKNIFYDLNYFKYCFLKLTGAVFDENRLEDDFEALADRLLQADCRYFVYRDFQSRNIMLEGDRPCFIDFQGARKGPLEYDLASFVWQARAGYPDDLRKRLVNAYLDELSGLLQVDRTVFMARLRVFVFFRMLQVLGAYGYRGIFEGKRHFKSSIPYALKNMHGLFAPEFLGCPVESLRKVDGGDLEGAVPYIRELMSSSYWKAACLEVEIYSFSYKKGLPADRSGNGGGYVFDCRGILNPGRFEQYASLDGRDEAVARFIEEKTEMPVFLENVFSLIDMHVETFMARGFEHLFVAFGCTGGRHRSVYCAERLASHLEEKYGVRIRLVHREMEALG